MSKLSKVEFLMSSAGAYGKAEAGDKLVINSKVAEELEKRGVLKITGDAPESAQESIPQSGSVRFTTEKVQGGPAAQETDDANPTKEKKSPAGPNAKKK